MTSFRQGKIRGLALIHQILIHRVFKLETIITSLPGLAEHHDRVRILYVPHQMTERTLQGHHPPFLPLRPVSGIPLHGRHDLHVVLLVLVARDHLRPSFREVGHVIVVT